jgi:hypothetical protein
LVSGLRQETPLSPNEVFNFTDDSGTRGTLTPTPNLPNPFFDGFNDTTPFLTPGQLTVRTFATDDNLKGGEILVDVTVGDDLSDTVVGNHGST